MIDKDRSTKGLDFFKSIKSVFGQKLNVNGLFYYENWLVITAVTNLKVVLAKGIYFLLGDKSLWDQRLNTSFIYYRNPGNSLSKI